MEKEPQEKKEMEELLKNKKFRKAMKGILAPLQQEGDSLTISFGKESVKIDYKDIDKLWPPYKNSSKNQKKSL